MSWQHAFSTSRVLCFKGAQGHSDRPICTPTSAARCRFCLLATPLLVRLPSPPNLHQTHPSATQLSCSPSRVPVCLRALPTLSLAFYRALQIDVSLGKCVWIHSIKEPYPCHRYFLSLHTRVLLIVLLEVY